MQYSITRIGQILLTQPVVLGHCPVEKQMIVPRRDGVSLQNAVVDMLVKCALNSKLITDSVTSKAPHTITPHPCSTVGITHAEIIRSPTLHLTKTQRLEAKISNLDSKDRFPPV